MNKKQIVKHPKQDLSESMPKSTRKEDNMSKKTVLRILLSAGLLVVVLFAVQVFTTESASAPSSMDPAIEERLAGSDNISLHPPVPLPANFYNGSDWIERHPNNDVPVNYFTFATPTPLPANYYTGSDWIERHPCQPTP
jgi:hypothetical protein